QPLGPKFRGDGLAHEERGLEVAREEFTPIGAIHPGRRHPRRRLGATGHVHEAVQVTVGAPRVLDHGTDAVIGRRVSGDGYDGKAFLRQRSHMFVEVLLRATDRDHGGARLGGHAGDGRADSATPGARHHHDAAVQLQEIIHVALLFVRTTYDTLHIAEHYSAVVITSSRPHWIC